MKGSFEIALMLCGITQGEAAELLGVSEEQIASWFRKEEEAPPDVWYQLSQLHNRIGGAGAGAAEAILSREIDLRGASRALNVNVKDDPLPGLGGQIAGTLAVLKAVGGIVGSYEDQEQRKLFVELLLKETPPYHSTGAEAKKSLVEAVARQKGMPASQFRTGDFSVAPFEIDEDDDGQYIPVPCEMSDRGAEPEVWAVMLNFIEVAGKPGGAQVVNFHATQAEAIAESDRLNGAGVVH